MSSATTIPMQTCLIYNRPMALTLITMAFFERLVMHQENTDSHVRMLFTDFRSTFDSIIPQVLIREAVHTRLRHTSVTGYWTFKVS